MAALSDKPSSIFSIDFENGILLQQNHVSVIFGHEHNRKPCPIEFIARKIDDVWQSACSLNSSLWNGSKFRLQKSFWNCNDKKLILSVGKTDYKSYIGTNCSEIRETLIELGQSLHGHSQVSMSDSIGVGALLLSSDNKIMLIRRSSRVGEHCGKLDLPGGHPEPEVRGIITIVFQYIS